MTDGEAVRPHQRRVAPGALEVARPERPRDVGQDAGAVTLAVDQA